MRFHELIKCYVIYTYDTDQVKTEYKMRQQDNANPLLMRFESYISNWFQLVVLQGCVFDYMGISADVPKGSILVSIMFMVYINDN